MLKIIIEKELQEKMDRGELPLLAGAISSATKLINKNLEEKGSTKDVELKIDGKGTGARYAYVHMEGIKPILSFNLDVINTITDKDTLESLIIHETAHKLNNDLSKILAITLPLVATSFAPTFLGLHYAIASHGSSSFEAVNIDPEKMLLGVLGSLILGGITFLTHQFISRGHEERADNYIVELKGPEALLKQDDQGKKTLEEMAAKAEEPERSKLLQAIIDNRKPRSTLSRILDSHPTPHENKVRMQREFPDKFPSK